MTDNYNRLLELIHKNSFKYSEEPVFTLVSGQKSQYYFNCKATTLDSEGLVLVGNVFFERIEDFQVDAIGGLTMGADPIAIATSLISFQKGRAIKAFCIRKEPKKHGLKLWIEGNLDENDNVIIIEDVITTGGSAIKAIQRAQEANANVVSAIALIDREEGGKEAIEKLGIHVESIFTKSDIMAFHRAAEGPQPNRATAQNGHQKLC